MVCALMAAGAVVFALGALAAARQSGSQAGAGAAGSSAQSTDNSLNTRGEHVMGFSQDKTSHHFELTKTGGTIQVTVKDAADVAIRDHIRVHLQHIAKSFAAGDFEDPMEVHAEVPPGVPVMKERKAKISYRYESIEQGGRVVIGTQDPEALGGVHDYLRYQIREHKTGDSLEVK
jgi:hypothetical protein